MQYRVWWGAALAALCMGTTAQAATSPTDRWLPNSESATWTYGWSDSVYSSKTTLETYTVDQRTDNAVRLAWTTDGLGNPEGTSPSSGTMDYLYTDTGIVNTNWSSTPPPPQFPVLCASIGQCGNSLAGAHYQLIWGSRTPVLQEPLVKGATWSSAGGQSNDVAAVSRYLGVERVVVPAFPLGVFAAKIQSDITQAGAIGDPYGSGLRTTWWVYGVGPVKITFRHPGGELTQTDLYATNLRAGTTPSDLARLPLQKGNVMRFRYTNSKHMKTPSVQEFTVADVVNNTARVDVKDVSGPIRVAGSYVFSTRRTGITNLSAATSAATLVKFPKLGPRSLPPARRRHFFTPLDLMSFGFNPVLPAFPVKGQKWTSSRAGPDRAFFGVTGTTTVVGDRKVKTPSGTYTALLLESKLTQKGFPFGSGVRRSWFAPGVGLVKLEFRHRDGSVSLVTRLPA
ncbi:MAG: hypothetical protein JWN65_2641 [Solirubrobacterales bacterium]|nr:hypothetical protein [Solirubrobacterales bacterium]